MPWERNFSTSRRVTPWARSSVTAWESGSWKSAAIRSPASTSSFSALSACWSACWITRWKARVCWSWRLPPSGSFSTSSSRKFSSSPFSRRTPGADVLQHLFAALVVEQRVEQVLDGQVGVMALHRLARGRLERELQLPVDLAHSSSTPARSG